MLLITFEPDNRLVADSLEADWNAKLKMLAEAQELCERQREQDRKIINDQQQAAILSLASSFPQLWRDPAMPDRERKRIVRLLLEDVTLIRGDGITLHLRFKGGAQRTIQLPLPLRSWEQRQTSKEAVAEIDRLIAAYDKDLAGYKEGIAAVDQSAPMQAMVNCSYYNKSSSDLEIIEKAIDKMAADNLPKYQKGLDEFQKRKSERKMILPPKTCVIV